MHTWLEQCNVDVHSTHAAAPSHTVPPFDAQGAPAARGLCSGFPATQRSVVQSLSSARISVSSGTILTEPIPSQTSWTQSLGVSLVVTVPADASTNPHKPALHVLERQTVSVPGQSPTTLQVIPPPPEPPAPPVPDSAGICVRSGRAINSQPADDPNSAASNANLDAASALEAERLHPIMLFSKIIGAGQIPQTCRPTRTSAWFRPLFAPDHSRKNRSRGTAYREVESHGSSTTRQCAPLRGARTPPSTLVQGCVLRRK